MLKQKFTATAANRKWLADITYLPTAVGWVYLAVVLDLFSRKVIGWDISESPATPLVHSALRQAVESRSPKPSELLRHSDRGCQYTSDDYQSTLRTMGITCSMSRTGGCYDNAVMERFFSSLKHQSTKLESLADLQHARLSVFRYIESFYNLERIHQSPDYLAPDRFEAQNDMNIAVQKVYRPCPSALSYRIPYGAA